MSLTWAVEAEPQTPDAARQERACPVVVAAAQRRGITSIMHFTRVDGCKGIFSSGVVKARQDLPLDARVKHVYEENAADRSRDLPWHGYINLSITTISRRMFEFSKREHPDDEWVILEFSPDILGDPGVVFSTTNNAYANTHRARGPVGFDQLFAPQVPWGHYGSTSSRYGRSDDQPTDPQAEVLYPFELTLDHMHTITVGDNDTYESVEAIMVHFPHPADLRLDPAAFQLSAAASGPAQEPLFDAPDERTARARSSMLWAAYGDALGFISELADERAVRRRTRGAPLDHLMAWTRRVGGRFGVDVELPAGCWSDDTQLRLATCRAIGPNGFDVESFARVELPVWPSYALGGGRASKAAAQNLGKSDSLWYANTFHGWTDAGGNGVAMRVQPHVWASTDLAGDFVVDVLVNAVCTHGHPRAIAGALFHAATLAHCMRVGRPPSLDDCLAMVTEMSAVLDSIAGNRQLGSTWFALWERDAEKEFRPAWQASLEEIRHALGLALASEVVPEDVAAGYARVVKLLGLREADQRGSGILTPIAAAALAAMAPDPHVAIVVAASVLGSDTDTIATMTGALVGACRPNDLPPSQPLDANYLIFEADRLTAIGRGEAAAGHSYPDVLSWVAPPTQADALVVDHEGLLVEGLGRATEFGDRRIDNSKGDFSWQWIHTSFGQTLLIKRRPTLPPLQDRNTLLPPASPEPARDARVKERGLRRTPKDRGVNLDGAVSYAREHIDDNAELGYTVRRVARDGSLSDLVALVVAVREDLRR